MSPSEKETILRQVDITRYSGSGNRGRSEDVNVPTIQKGDRVCALVSGGGYAEFSAVPEAQCLPIPANLSFVDAASLPETLFTVWSNVFDRCRLQPGETFLVHGGTSGIGVAAIQMVNAWGCEVFATAGTDDKVQACQRLGAKRGIN